MINNNIQNSIDSESVVRGTLALVLRFSRFLGVAPLRIQSTGDGYRVSISHYFKFYSYIFISTLNVSVLCALYLDVEKRAIRTKNITNLAFLMPDLITSLSSASFAGYNSVNRMKTMIKHLNLFDKVKKNMNSEVIRLTPKRTITVITYMIVALTLLTIFGVDLFLNYYSKEKLLTILYCIYLCEYVPMILWEIQVILLTLEVHSVLLAMSTKMDEIFSMDIYEYRLALSSTEYRVRAFSRSYIAMCEAISEMNKVNGGVILIIFINFIITSIMSFYYGFFLYSVLSPIYLFMQQAWCFIYIILALALLESCHSVKDQEIQLKARLSKLICKFAQVGDRMPIVMEIMFKNLIINTPHYSPMDVFTLNRSFITTITSAIITYMLLMIQLDL